MSRVKRHSEEICHIKEQLKQPNKQENLIILRNQVRRVRFIIMLNDNDCAISPKPNRVSTKTFINEMVGEYV